MENPRNEHLKVKICVSGAAETSHCGDGALDIAKTLGREIATQGAVIVTGATTGFPLWAARGAKEAGGVSLGLSPAHSEREHVEFYQLPLEYMDFIVYTGAGFPGRDLLLTRTSDAIILGCGRVGTIHEFTIGFEDGKPVGVLQGSWTTDEVIQSIIDNGHRQNNQVIFDNDPKQLVARIIEMVKKQKAEARGTPYAPSKTIEDAGESLV